MRIREDNQREASGKKEASEMMSILRSFSLMIMEIGNLKGHGYLITICQELIYAYLCDRGMALRNVKIL